MTLVEWKSPFYVTASCADEVHRSCQGLIEERGHLSRRDVKVSHLTRDSRDLVESAPSRWETVIVKLMLGVSREPSLRSALTSLSCSLMFTPYHTNAFTWPLFVHLNELFQIQRYDHTVVIYVLTVDKSGWRWRFMISAPTGIQLEFKI